MTEQEIEIARADMAQLDIGQLRCGVMLQLMHIERLTKERDEYARAADTQAAAHKVERDALLVAAKYAEHIDATLSNQVQTMLYDTLIERDELRLQIDIQAGSIEAVQSANQRLAKERDALQSRVNQQAAMVEKSIEEMNRNADIGSQAGKERDELVQRLDVQTKAAGHWMSESCRDHNALEAAAKLAVAALDDWYYGANQDRPKATVFAALQALKAAGVK